MRYYFCCRASVTLTDLDRIQPLLEEGIRLNKAALRSSGTALRAGLATIFSVSIFGKKNHRFARMANQWLLVGVILFSYVPASNSFVSVWDPWRAFWADTAPFKGPQLALCVCSGTTEKQGHHQVLRARHRGPRTLPKTTEQTLCFCWKCTFLHRSLIVKSQLNGIEIVARPACV